MKHVVLTCEFFRLIFAVFSRVLLFAIRRLYCLSWSQRHTSWEKYHTRFDYDIFSIDASVLDTVRLSE
jgi:hypothetical protein